MKKLIYVLTFLLFLIPFNVKAYGINNYRMDVTVLENGDIKVLEVFEMTGDYNGFERIINYKNNFDSYYGSTLSSTNDANIYNGNNVILDEIRGVNFKSDEPFTYFKDNGDLFTRVTTASKGDYGVYTVNKRDVGETYVIYNHSNRNKDFYLSYTLENMAITHEDIAELGFNIFTQMTESIDNLEIIINIPNNKELLRVWAHGPLNGKSEIIDNQTIKINVSNLDANVPIDFRLAFDKEAISLNKKVTNIEALDKIVAIENKLADEANQKRDEEYKKIQNEAYQAVELVKQTKKQKDYDSALVYVAKLKDDDDLKKDLTATLNDLESIVKEKEFQRRVIYTSIIGAWFLGVIILIIYIYLKYDKENKASFQGKYFREFPNDYNPATVGYLVRKKINNDDLSASILNLINKKIIKYESLGDKDFKFTKVKEGPFNEADDRLLEFLFDKEETITLKQLQKQANNNYEKFITNYSNWFNRSLLDAENENFYEKLFNQKVIVVVFGVIGFILMILLSSKDLFINLMWVGFTSVIVIIYGLVFSKRTVKGNEDYKKWMALKRFMLDFGNMETKELPEIILWEKYLVYAVTLGCSTKLAKVMKIKVEQMNIEDVKMTNFTDILIFNSLINHSITNVINTAYQAKASADSDFGSNSSGGGFGGGFSSGGGSFGGGGGGGRF